MTWKIKRRVTGTIEVLTRGAEEFWLTLGVLLVGLLIPGFWTGSCQTWLRQSGIFLQLAGLGTAAVGIYQTQRRFDLPSLSGSVRNWWAKLRNAVLLPPVTGSGNIVTAQPGVGAAGWAGLRPTIITNPEERLRALGAAVDELGKGLARVNSEIRQLDIDLRAEITKESAERQQAIAEVRREIEEDAAESLHLEAMGLVWILAGTVLGLWI